MLPKVLCDGEIHSSDIIELACDGVPHSSFLICNFNIGTTDISSFLW